MVAKRSRLEMYLDVLETVSSGITRPTNIMYRCNLSWIPMREILVSLIEKDLIRETGGNGKRTYEITEKGRELLQYLRHILVVLESRKHRSSVIPSRYARSAILAQLDRRNPSPVSQRNKQPDSGDS